MPKQIFDSKTFKSLIPRAEEVRVVRTGEKTKIKLRTKSMLYTYVSDDTEAEKLLKNVDKPIVEINPKEKKQKKEEEEAEKQEKKEEKGKGKEKAKQEKEKGEEGEEAKEEKEASKQSPPPAKKERKRSASKSGKDEEKSEGE